MRALLDSDIEAAASRVRIRPAQSTDDLAIVHAVLEDAVAGHWKHQRRTFADFLDDQQSRPGHNPSLWFLAEYAGAPADAVIAREPVDRAWIAWLGVHPAYRRRGIADALLRTAFSELHRRGHTSVGVDVDTHNQTGSQTRLRTCWHDGRRTRRPVVQDLPVGQRDAHRPRPAGSGRHAPSSRTGRSRRQSGRVGRSVADAWRPTPTLIGWRGRRENWER